MEGQVGRCSQSITSWMCVGVFVRSVPRSGMSGSEVTHTDTTWIPPSCPPAGSYRFAPSTGNVWPFLFSWSLDCRDCWTNFQIWERLVPSTQERKRKQKFIQRRIWRAARRPRLTPSAEHLQCLRGFPPPLCLAHRTKAERSTAPHPTTALRGPVSKVLLPFPGDKRRDPGRRHRWRARDWPRAFRLCTSQLSHLKQVSGRTHKPHGAARGGQTGSCFLHSRKEGAARPIL